MKISKRILFVLFTVLVGSASLKAQSWEQAQTEKKATINVLYFENAPYAYKAKGEFSGIEIDIVKSFAKWVKEKKGIDLKLKFESYSEFDKFYGDLKNGDVNAVGLGSVTISDKRAKEVNFSAPYLNNVAVLVTDGSVPTARNQEDLKNNIYSLRPISLKGSSHQVYIENWYAKNNEVKAFEFVRDAEMIPMKIKENAKYFGYVDIITYWKFLKTNDHYIKMHRIANKSEEQFGFIFPKESGWDLVFNEFFESGFGFTATKEYHNILMKHLGFEIIDKVEIN